MDTSERPLTGIYARKHLPSAAYDFFFELIYDHGKFYCVHVPGRRGYDKHYFEEVPMSREDVLAVALQLRRLAEIPGVGELGKQDLRMAAEIEAKFPTGTADATLTVP